MIAAAVARFAASNFSIGACIEVEQSMMMASTRSGAEVFAATSAAMLTIASTVPASLSEVRIVVDVNGPKCLVVQPNS